MKNVMIGSYVYNDEIINFNYCTDLSVSEKLSFVNSVVDIVVDEDKYNSIIKDLMFDYMIIKVFTDIDISFLRAIDEDGNKTFDIDLLEDFLLETNIVDIVKANVSYILFDELNNAINKSIEYKTGIYNNRLEDALSNLVNTIEKKVNAIDMGDIDLNKMSEMVQLFTSMSEKFTPENVVKAYTQSDVFKKNMVDIEEARQQRIESLNETGK